jgi:alkylation response protein AidB-like acyl-CoA dehydrogenase
VEIETRYHPNADQVALAGTIEDSLRELLPLSRLHASYHEDARTWDSLEDIGVFAIGVSEEQGGSGLGAIEEALIVLSLGRCLASPAVFATLGAVHALSNGEGRGRRVAAAYRHGDRVLMVDEPDASLVLVRDREGATLYDARSCISKVIDDRLWLAALREVVRLSEPLAHFNLSQLARLRLIDAAALAGLAQAALEMSVAYAGQREQFGRPIGTFQAIKHHCANMALAARCARDQTTFASVALEDRRSDAPLQVDSALFVAGSAALENAKLNIQIHGGMGFSDEADPHLLLKRAQLLSAIAGGLEAANARIATDKNGE